MNTLTRAVLSVFLLAGVTATAPAFADTLDNFTVTDGSTGNIYTFTLPASPTPTTVVPGNYFDITPVEISVNGGAATAGTVYFLELATGGIGIGSSAGFLFDEGPQLFTGTLNDPTFKLGTFTVFDDSAPQTPADNGTVVIAAASAVPEPGSLALFGTGALGLIGAVRRRFSL